MKKRIFIIIACADLIFASWLNEPYTTYSHIYTTKSVKEHSNTFPEGFPLPSSCNVVMNTDTGLSNGTFWKNMNIFHKEIAWDGFTPFKFKGYEYLSDSMPGLFRSMLTNPPVFLTDRIFPEDSMRMHNETNTYCHKNIYFSKGDFVKLNDYGLSENKGDTAFITSFSPVDIKIHVLSKEPQLLALLQNYYPGWTVTINKNDSQILQYNKGFMSVQIPKGESTIEFKYYNSKVVFASAISVISLFSFVVIIFLKRKSIGSDY